MEQTISPAEANRLTTLQDALMEMPVNSRIMTRSKSDTVERLGSSGSTTLVTSSRVHSGVNQASEKAGALWVVSSANDWLAQCGPLRETLTPASRVSSRNVHRQGNPSPEEAPGEDVAPGIRAPPSSGSSL